jgi:hypothetical protein
MSEPRPHWPPRSVLDQRRHRSLRLCLRAGFSPIKAIVLTGKTWYPELGQAHAAGRVSCRRSPQETIACPAVGVPRTWKGFGYEKSSIGASGRCHHRSHCLGNTITGSGAARRLGWLECRSHARANCRYGGRWNSGRRPRPWPRLLLLPRSGRRLRSRILRPLVLYGVSIRSVSHCRDQSNASRLSYRFLISHQKIASRKTEELRAASAQLPKDCESIAHGTLEREEASHFADGAWSISCPVADLLGEVFGQLPVPVAERISSKESSCSTAMLCPGFIVWRTERRRWRPRRRPRRPFPR